MSSFDFMQKDFDIKNIIKLIAYWYIVLLCLRFSVFNMDTWSINFIIIPVWFSIMAIGGYNNYKIRTYITDRYANGEYVFNVNKILRENKDRKDDMIIQHFQKNTKRFAVMVISVMVSIPFLLLLTQIDWTLR